ncbi:uncharacterized protein LOC141640770 [Silene latifolia]|uniref:uncharacterized protein LOC141640770 n=1 Tax=Silene latifolia TaxID=37657 RepID=UPI003D77B4BA
MGFWNIRGLNKINKQMDIRRFLHLNKLDIFGLIETRVKHNKWMKVSNFISGSWSVCTNHQSHKGGRIWVLWNPQALTLDVQHISTQTVHTRVTDRGRNLTYWVTFVYGFNKAVDRKVLWSTLENYHKVTPGAWLIGGDFNNILHSNERIGATITSVEMAPFQHCVQNCGVEDIKAMGYFLTWTNKQEVHSRFYSRIDRALINDEWLNLFPESFANFLPEGVYDHSLVSFSWNQQTGLGIFPLDILICGRKLLISWVSLRNTEKQAAVGFKVLDEARVAFLAQKAKVNWLEEGDDNTAFFHSTIKKRRVSNKVVQIEDETGNVLTQIQDINAAFENYYIQLLGTSCPVKGVHHPTIRHSTILTEQHHRCLARSVTGDEVRRAIFSIPGNKSPSPDGFNYQFFKDAWGVIGGDVVVAVQDFFITGKLLKQINNTTLTLIPKVDMPKSVNQFRPIAHCNTIYKCIAKILCNRLGEILPDIISPTQSAFIKDRDIVENILICQDLNKLYNRKHCSPRVIMKLDLQKAYV